MSTPFPKTKEKRPRSSSEPNKSFVKNVTSRVSGLLPATITKWFSSSSSSNTNGSVQVADATDSSTEDEAPESPITIQPPPKKMRYNAPGEFSQLVKVETRCMSTNTESVDDSYTAHSPIARSNSRRENIFASTRVHSANNTSNEESAQKTIFIPQHSLSEIDNSMATKRKSLFGTPRDDYYKKHYANSSNVRDPYFKPSLLSSPFYVGRTMYGGATSSYLTPSSLKEKTISLTSESTNEDSVNMSHSSRYVMDLLEHYSSPLIEAKRIPPITRDPEKHGPNNLLQQSSSTNGPKVYSYKTQELHVPSIASILTIKRKSRLMDTTNAARQIIASHSSSSEFLPYPKVNSEGDKSEEVSTDKLTTKIKSRLTRTNRERNIEMENNSSDSMVNLPNVVLQIDKDNLPKFTFGPITSSQPTHSSSIQTPVIITPEALKKTSETDKLDLPKLKNVDLDKPLQVKNNNECYKFSRPVQISSESNKTPSSLPKFSFGNPESNIEKIHENKTKNEEMPLKNSNQIVLDNKLQAQKNPGWRCLDCWVMNKVDDNKCVCCGGKKPVEINDDSKKCSVCNISIKQSQYDKCADCEKKTNNIDKPFVIKETNPTKWKCNDCWVDNNESVDKCVCCGGKNRKKTTPVAVINPEKSVESDWKCNDCWITNKSTLAKCAACGGSKPDSQNINNFGNKVLLKDSQSDNKVKDNLDNTFKNIAKSQSEKWECPLCLVRNESNRDTCICCEANKPGTEKESHTKFNFHQPSEITFKFGIQPKQQDTLTDIEPEECNMGEESETNNNILPKTSTFNFGLPVKKFDEQSESMDKPTEAPKINFTFGVSKEIQMPPVRNTIFGIPNKSMETNKGIEEKLQEVPQVFTPPQSTETVKKNLGLFNTPVTSPVAPEMQALVPLLQLNQNSSIKKDTPFLSTSVIPSTSSEAKTPENNFTFPSIMPPTNLFSKAPTTTTAISNVLPAPLSMTVPASTTISIFQKPNVVTTTTSSFFQKSDSLPTLGVSLFSKTESTTTTSSVPMGTMQPVFSFGGQASVPQVEKPKFNFNFTSNKTDSAAIFKPAFGVSTDNNISNNKFNLASNTIVGGNAISANPLNSSTQINAANALTSGTAPSGSSIFGSTVPKENMWTPNTSNIFATNTTTNGVQKPPAFTFGTATPFSASNAPFGTTTPQAQQNNTPFGSTVQQAQVNNVPFGSTTQQAQPNNVQFGSTAQQAPANNVPFGSTTQQAQTNNVPFGSTAQQAQPNNVPFGNSTQQAQTNNAAFGSTAQPSQQTQPSQNIFGIGGQTTTSQPPMFGNHLQSQTTPNIFGGLQVANNPMPMGMFGAPNPAVTPSFGTLNPSIPTFETSTLPPPQPAPTSFNFGGQPAPATCNIFGFGQQQQQPSQSPLQPENQPGMYGFGGPTGPAPQMQFTIGSAPNTTGRRVRKAIRRTPR